jgi:hypothetical protein
MWYDLLEKIHIRSVSLLLGGLFAIAGILMTIYGIKDEGFIDIQSAIISGKLKTGFVGVTFAFLGAITIVICSLVKVPHQRLKITNGESSIEWEGVVNSTRKLLIQMESMVKSLSEGRRLPNELLKNEDAADR